MYECELNSIQRAIIGVFFVKIPVAQKATPPLYRARGHRGLSVVFGSLKLPLYCIRTSENTFASRGVPVHHTQTLSGRKQ